LLLSKIVNYIKGYITIIIKGVFPERFVNLCVRRGIGLWNAKKIDKSTIQAQMDIRDFHKVHKFHKNSRCRVHIIGKFGLPFIINKYKRRKAFLAGIVIFVLLIALLSRFVWIIQITGNEKIKSEEIIKYANKVGIRFGMLTSTVDVQEARRQMMTNNENLSFVTVNISGCTVSVDIREREVKREHFDKAVVSNLVAKKSGVIESTLVRSGNSVVKKGDVVLEGQLLVSGAENMATKGIKYSHSDGEIMAKVWYDETVNLPYSVKQKQYTGNEKSKNRLVIFNKFINLFIKNKILFEKYDKLSYTKYIQLGNGRFLPFGVEVNEYKEYTEKTVKLNEKEAKAYLTEKYDKLCKGSKIINKSFNKQGSKLTVTYECIEDIAKEEEVNDRGKAS